jgi:Protein of unknown function (DUF3179)
MIKPVLIVTLAVVMFASITGAMAQESSAKSGRPGQRSPSRPLVQPVEPGIQTDKLWDGRAMAPFKSIDNPPSVTAAEASFLSPEDYVLGVSINGVSRAYPTRFVWFHHVVNDTLGKPGAEVPICITYCSVCNTGICYDPIVNGKSLKLDFFGLYNGIVALVERDTEGVFLQGEGRIINGPMMNTSFKTLPLLDTTWAQWQKLHPDTTVMSPDTDFKKFYSPADHPEPRGYDHFPAPYFQPTVTRGDLRLPPFDKVLGTAIQIGEAGSKRIVRRAYPIKAIASAGGVVNDETNGTHVVVFLDPQSLAASAYTVMLGNKPMTFELHGSDGKIGFYDTQTHSKWNIEGVCVEGKLKGKHLDRVDSHLSQWYGWNACFPDTTVFGSDAAPMPGNPFDQASK